MELQGPLFSNNTSEALPQTDENRMESISHRRDAEHTEMIHLFSLPLRRQQRKMDMPLRQDLISSNNLREALGLPLFCPLSRKEETFSSGISVPLAKPRRGGTSGR